jgi:hypothetical protein
LGSFRWLINLWFILLTPSTFCTTVIVHHIFPYVVVPQGSPVRDGWDLFKWEPTSRLCLYVVVPHGSHVRDGWDLIQREPTIASMSRRVLPYMDVPHCELRGKDMLHSKRSVSEVGRCPCSGLKHGYCFYK